MNRRRTLAKNQCAKSSSFNKFHRNIRSKYFKVPRSNAPLHAIDSCKKKVVMKTRQKEIKANPEADTKSA
jgi:hypothetical protein